MSIAFWPPELISGMMYTGPGSGPLMAAAAAWQSLAAELNSSATSFQSVLSGLSSAWQGPSSTQMTGAAEPYLSWLASTATQAQQAGVQAGAAAAAFETAFGATVPPPVIAANRALQAALIATNFFGQNSPAIAATEAQYAEMWAQDVGMLQGYGAAAQTATAGLQSFTPAPAVTTGTSGAQAAAASAGSSASSLLSGLSTAIQGAFSGLLSGTGPLSGISTGLSTIASDLGISTAGSSVPTSLSSALGGLSYSDIVPLQGAYYLAMMGSIPARMFMSMGQSAAGAGTASANFDGLLTNVGTLVDGKMQAIVGSVSGQLRSWGSSVSAQLAHAANIGGRMSVPQGWSAAATTMSRAAPILPATSVPSPTLAAPSAGMPGGPFGQALAGALSGRGLSNVAGAKVPKVVPRSPAAG